MGLMLSAILSYAGALEAIEFFKDITNGMVPEGEPNFEDLVEYYKSQLQSRTNHSSSANNNWIDEDGHGYLCLTEDDSGKLKSVTLKYYGNPNSTAILLSTKVCILGNDSIDSRVYNNGIGNGEYGGDKCGNHTKTTRTMISNTSESVHVRQRSKSPTIIYDEIPDSKRILENSLECKDEEDDKLDTKEKLTWRYRPLSPSSTDVPDISFQSYDANDDKGVYDEEFLRSLDGIKFRPLQRSDPNGRRKSFRKRNSSSSTSSRESRASREEELRIFTSLEEAEIKQIGIDKNVPYYRSTPNLDVHSSCSGQENSNEKINNAWSTDASVDSVDGDEIKTQRKDFSKLESFEEEAPAENHENNIKVIEEDVDDFWGNSAD